ncbi:hypothetical protein GCM10011519_28980 [Marmoricola endophyticus]|uniref:Uncharacterized protein n=1 Tax=Marmoricola endophyticus TaxID=2040280 RepID=A0A917BNW7_9ACTN|nr:hypothetical protein GCM10011519_28980 [Marmoricola endophyticus]
MNTDTLTLPRSTAGEAAAVGEDVAEGFAEGFVDGVVDALGVDGVDAAGALVEALGVWREEAVVAVSGSSEPLPSPATYVAAAIATSTIATSITRDGATTPDSS